MKTNHKIIMGDSRQMTEVPDESVHLIITSPPYWQLKDYGNGGQIGFNDSYEEYINNLNLVWQECRRVLHKGCRLSINIGDQFARSVYYGRYKIIPIRTEIIKFCETIGLDYMGAVIWQKVTTCNTTGGATIMGSFPYPRNGVVKIDYEFILIFKKLGNPPKVTKEIKEKSRLTAQEWNEYFYGHWNFSGERQDKHLAVFPEELPKRLIKMFSFAGETVLDPFLGSGTTTLAAKNLNRNSIGYEINDNFLPVIKERLGLNHPNIFNVANFEITSQEKPITTHKEMINDLPYIFKDPVGVDKKIDVKKLRFGSKIDDTRSEREEYYSVKEVTSPETLILDNGLNIRLIGIKTRPEYASKAMEFLKHKTLGQKVFLRFDSIKYDNKSNLFCYLYLKNKTFVNAHYIKSGFVNADTSCDYKYKSKFLILENQLRENLIYENKAYK